MRFLLKPTSPPVAISEYVTAQTNVGHGFDYPTFASTASPIGGSRGGQLCQELIAQQCGLCAYTGAGIDERLGVLVDAKKRLKFKAHNEHLKPQSVCKAEFEAEGRVYGEALAEDMDHRNIVAALMVDGTRVAHSELFGAAHRKNLPVPVQPTDPNCEPRFSFGIDGTIAPKTDLDIEATQAIRILNLSHSTLEGWRKQAIDTFTEVIQTRADAELIIQKTTVPENGKLPEYCFAVKQIAQIFLANGP